MAEGHRKKSGRSGGSEIFASKGEVMVYCLAGSFDSEGRISSGYWSWQYDSQAQRLAADESMFTNKR